MITADQVLTIRDAYWAFVDTGDRENNSNIDSLFRVVTQNAPYPNTVLANLQVFANHAESEFYVQLWHSSRPPPTLFEGLVEDLVNLLRVISGRDIVKWVERWYRSRNGNAPGTPPSWSPFRSPERIPSPVRPRNWRDRRRASPLRTLRARSRSRSPPSYRGPPTRVMPLQLVSASRDVEEVGARDCVVCLDRAASYILIPCGHMVLCRECARFAGPGKTVEQCPICREIIHGVYRVY